MLEINSNVVYIKGIKKGAIYDFNSGKVYWISNEACDFINRLYSDPFGPFTTEEKQYIENLGKNGLYDPTFQPKIFAPSYQPENNIELAWLEITQACNCKCVHCYQGDQHFAAKNQLECSEWLRVIEELAKLHVNRVVVIGGEPCVHKDIVPILEKLCELHISTTLFTNATRLDQTLIDLIINHKDLISVKVSLYGKTEQIHEAVTQTKGSYRALVSTVKKLTEKKVRVDFAVVAMKENQDDLDGLEAFAHELGANYSKFDVIRNVSGGCQNQHAPTRVEVIERAQYRNPNFKTSREDFVHNMFNNSCWHGKVAITEDGDVLPCVFERDMKLGNVKTASIREILASPPLLKAWQMDFSQIEVCKDCEFRYACRDCRPMGRAATGDYSAKNPRCCYDPYTGEWKNE